MTVPASRLLADHSDPDRGVDTSEVVEWRCACTTHLVSPLTWVGECGECGGVVLSYRMWSQYGSDHIDGEGPVWP